MKTYIFGIGGTGARVIKSLTMLLSAGVEINTDEVVPVFIDTDAAAANLTETVTLLEDYKSINESLQFAEGVRNRFFKTRVTQLVGQFRLDLANTQGKKFKDYIGFATLDEPNKALAQMLFSQDNLETSMTEGFLGNPNIGSVVLNQFSQTKAFAALANNFQKGDRIFIISSIFGGTGASGFPLLLKNLRSMDPKSPNANLIQNAPIGAITVLPYFNVGQDSQNKNRIDSSTFVSKTQAALEYYAANISGNNSLNALYYLGDTPTAMYSYSEGGTTQRNKAHLMEFIAALAVIDFCRLGDNSLKTQNGVAVNPVYKEFGVQEDGDVNFKTFYDGTQQLLRMPMTQFTLMCKYLNEQLDTSRKDQAWTRGKRPFDDAFFSGSFFQQLSSVKEAYMNWLEEMGNNQRKFVPFLLEERKNDVFGLVNGVPPGKVMSLKSNYALFDSYLNGNEGKIPSTFEAGQRFMELFYQTTDKLVADKKLA